MSRPPRGPGEEHDHGHRHDHGHGQGHGHDHGHGHDSAPPSPAPTRPASSSAAAGPGHAPAGHAPAGHNHAGHDHAGHDHAHDHRSTPESRLKLLVGIQGGYMFVEAAAGWWSGSLALLADADEGGDAYTVVELR